MNPTFPHRFATTLSCAAGAAFASALLIGPATAQTADPVEDARAVERANGVKDQNFEHATPDIRERRDEKGTQFREYRVAGQLYAVKVTPPVGAPYWLIQREGVMRRFDMPEKTLTVPSWLVLEW